MRKQILRFVLTYLLEAWHRIPTFILIISKMNLCWRLFNSTHFWPLNSLWTLLPNQITINFEKGFYYAPIVSLHYLNFIKPTCLNESQSWVVKNVYILCYYDIIALIIAAKTLNLVQEQKEMIIWELISIKFANLLWRELHFQYQSWYLIYKKLFFNQAESDFILFIKFGCVLIW